MGADTKTVDDPRPGVLQLFTTTRPTRDDEKYRKPFNAVFYLRSSSPLLQEEEDWIESGFFCNRVQLGGKEVEMCVFLFVHCDAQVLVQAKFH